MGIRRQIRHLLVAALPLLAISCSDEGPTATDASYNLTCPPAPATCGALAVSTCLGTGGSREILGINGDPSCDGETPIVAICEATQTSEGGLILTLQASVGDEFAFKLSGATVDPDAAMVEGSCEITITEDQLDYGGGNLGTCGAEPPSSEQPCQITNVVLGDADGADLSFDVECEGLTSRTTGNSFNVSGRDGNPARIRFARCTNF